MAETVPSRAHKQSWVAVDSGQNSDLGGLKTEREHFQGEYQSKMAQDQMDLRIHSLQSKEGGSEHLQGTAH